MRGDATRFPAGAECQVSVPAVRLALSPLALHTVYQMFPGFFHEKITAPPRDLAAKLDARRSAGEALGVARAAEDAARETWVAAYDSNAGAIRALYPKRRPQQDLFFDDFRARNAGEDDGGGDDPAPEPVPTPA